MKREKAAVKPENITGNKMSGWGGAKVVNRRLPSGIPLELTPDSDCVLVFLGYKDITDKIAAEDRGRKTVIRYLTFFDGRKVVSISESYAASEVEMKKDNFYYLHHQGEIEMDGRNPMKDLLIIELGEENDEIDCPARVNDSGRFKLTLDAIAELNYTRLNYPLRPEPAKA